MGQLIFLWDEKDKKVEKIRGSCLALFLKQKRPVRFIGRGVKYRRSPYVCVR